MPVPIFNLKISTKKKVVAKISVNMRNITELNNVYMLLFIEMKFPRGRYKMLKIADVPNTCEHVVHCSCVNELILDITLIRFY